MAGRGVFLPSAACSFAVAGTAIAGSLISDPVKGWQRPQIYWLKKLGAVIVGAGVGSREHLLGGLTQKPH